MKLKKIKTLIVLFIGLLLINSCKKTDPPIASFSMDKNNVSVNTYINFTNLSLNATSYIWDFGDGGTSTQENPGHLFTTAGTFTITLTATGKGGSNSTTKSVVINEAAPIATFSMDKTTCNIGDIITFTNQSLYATSYTWDFGDGSTSTSTNPTHSYSAAGTFAISLTATGKGGSNSTTKSITVTTQAAATLIGTWYNTFYVNGSPFNGTTVISSQSSSGTLTGYFEFSDGSGHTSLASTSAITGNSVEIDWPEYDSGLYYPFNFQGTANSTRDQMSGSVYDGSTWLGSWSASKTSKKKSATVEINSTNNDKERLMQMMGK